MSARQLVHDASGRLAAAGVASPDHDAAELLAHVLGTTRGRLLLVDGVDPLQQQRYDDLVARRAAREPLQHLLGSAAFRYVEVAVGPGVFVPRPETELLAGWAIDRAREVLGAGETPVVVDLCTGSGVIARSIADEVPEARVHAVELDPDAHAWAERNLTGTGVDLRLGDLATAFDDLAGQVHVGVGRRRGPRPRPAPGPLLRRRRPRRDPRDRRAWPAPAGPRRCRRGRARRRPGRVRSRRVQP